ncbi:MAG: sulfatase [Alphaproteobacteria bacterium]|nr:sulfatase [Alphaproteobacteria bacterium]
MTVRSKVLAVGSGARLAAVCAAFLAGGIHCGTPAPPSDEGAATYVLTRIPFASITVPPHSRPHAPTPPDRIPLQGWKADTDGYTAANPIRTRNLYFFKPSPGQVVETADGTPIPHKYFANGARPYWTYDAGTVTVTGLDHRPADDELVMVYRSATLREASLNRASSGADDDATFARATIQAGPESRTGLLLPAPAEASWTLTVPPRGELRFAPSLVQPEVMDGPPSDGADLAVRLTVDGTEQTLWTRHLTSDAYEPVTIPLTEHVGKTVTLTIASEPGGDPRFDYVFLADPVVATRKGSPRRVLLVFVDTLRPDHLSTYGYERDTAPALDALAKAGVRFDQMRSVAPWTLPSTRTMLTGVDPELYFSTPTLQGRLADAGFATAMFAGNLYLGANFGINRDWGVHHVELLPIAEPQVDRALAWLDEQEGRDAFLLLHLMDAHLPYEEPKSYRNLYAGEAPEGLKAYSFHRNQVTGARLRSKEDRQYIRDRYDNNIRYADDQLARVYARMGPDDVIVFLSDHGEEFWDHGGYEHGHSLYDELLHVPLVIRAPGLPAGAVVDAPTSTLDVTPTILDLVGLPTTGTSGTSLVAAAHHEPLAIAALQERPLAFGRPLYGKERWGSLHEGMKYTTVGANQMAFDIRDDPKERKDLLTKSPELADQGREAMSEALGRDVVDAYRIAPRLARRGAEDDLTITVTVPGGLAAVWVGEDPTESSLATVAWEHDADSFTATWPAPWRGTRDVWFVPAAPMAEVTPQLSFEAVVGDVKAAERIDPSKPTELEDGAPLLLRATTGSRDWELGFGITPLPLEGGTHLSGYDAEVSDLLEAMGYAVGDHHDEPAGGGKR